MTFAFIKGQPYQLNSAYRYMKMYFSKELPKRIGSDLINQFEKVLEKINNFNEKDLIGISKEVYDKNNENSIKSMCYS